MEQPYFFITLIASFIVGIASCIAGIAVANVLIACYKRGEPP